MATGQRTEPATPKRRQEARKKGQSARTGELGTALALLAAYAVFSGRGAAMADAAERLMRQGLMAMSDPEPLTAGQIQQLFIPMVILGLQMLAPLFAVTIAIGLFSQVAQVGFMPSSEGLRLKWERINPLSGLKRILSKRALVELLKSLFKVGLIGYLGYRSLSGALPELTILVGAPPLQAFSAGARVAGRLAATVGGAFLAVALLDYFYQRWEFEQSIRMSRKEVEDELKQTEGDPQVKSKLRQRQRQMAMGRMMQAVPEADVIVTNPIHLAVALKYDAGKMNAPAVVAKGAGPLAERIKALAKEHRIPIVENVELARALYYSVDMGGAVPAGLYKAVAEVLAFVYRIKKRR